ncbi:MAG: hypothetical protein MJZ38_02105 [archaeon]|nr:hypothetical protein [archaeon]
MQGLLMMKLYLDEILDGRTTFDARLHPTDRRGTVALVDSSTFRIHGTAEITGIRAITYEEFVRWHQVGPFRNTPIAPYHEGGTCYAYDLANVRRLPIPARMPRVEDAHMWVEVPERISRNLFSQTTLF